MAIEMQGRPIGQLSGGQKARLGMLVLRLAKPNFYLLDEPTNHLDIEGQEALEDGIAGPSGKLPAGLARPQLRAHRRQPVLADRAEEAGGAGRPREVLCIGRRGGIAPPPCLSQPAPLGKAPFRATDRVC